MSANYPAGVTDAHPHFNPQEVNFTAHCFADEALVIPSFAVKAALIELAGLMQRIPTATAAYAPSPTAARKKALEKIKELQGQIDEMEQEREYECDWQGEMELPVSEDAHWDCPRCGNERASDTIPEDRDPDEGWDSRYDD